MEELIELEATLRNLVRRLGEPEAKKWRKRVEKYANQIASGKTSDTPTFLAMYQGGMGSFLDFQGATAESHRELLALRDRAYKLASCIRR
ncbi:hypothetical protein [Lysobacter sp. Root916]|uniref:DUF6966 domain-containing protein n=1 Tax=Lysobacter sp. Root916 TaxID=1736606 RepID=UPI000B22B587|nr:hypothetical protein [Lysobacter sp. Root916]